MIIDLEKFIQKERRYWTELENRLDRMEKDPAHSMDLIQLRRFHYLYQRASADLAKIGGFSAEKDIRVYLESLVSRAYGEIHETRSKERRLKPLHWFFHTFPQTFRRHALLFLISVLVMSAGGIFGAFAIAFDREAKAILMPFPHLLQDPSERVAEEEKRDGEHLEGKKATFSSYLMTHNTRVSILTLALGVTFGIGTLILLFTNGVMLGAVLCDYILAGESVFLAGWLLPHGVVEIPAILIAGQAGLVLGRALIGDQQKILPMRSRLREISDDLVTLIFGVAVLLIWAGIVEAFLSQYHEPVIPYAAKIAFGVVELILLVLFLTRSGQQSKQPESAPEETTGWKRKTT